MTFSIAGFCRRSGMLGVAITTSSICVGARCPRVRAGVGAASSQNITDPSLGEALLDQVQAGHSATQSMRAVVAAHGHRDYRQLTLVDAHGATAVYTGEKTLGVHAAATGEHCVAAGNLLRDTGVPAAMAGAFAAAGEAHIAARLLGALAAGQGAGGEQGPVKSAALLVAHREAWPLVDLRVDWNDDDPVAELQRLWRAYEPQMHDYVQRALDPASAPAYGVPGDP